MIFARPSSERGRGPVNTAQAPNHDVGYIRDGCIRGEKNKTRHGDGTWGEMCITSWDSKCNVRTRNAIIMRTRPRSRRDARRAGAAEKEDGRQRDTGTYTNVTGRDTPGKRRCHGVITGR